MVRKPERLSGRDWLEHVEVRAGSTSDAESMEAALAGVHSAYYLIHSMSRGRGYTEIERESAQRFAEAASASGVEHIIYLGGLADPHDPRLAPHMRSRIETGETLRRGRVPVTEFRAGVIAGAGSISFEMVRFLTECFPILPGPTWLNNEAQPIAAGNVIDYLVAGLEKSETRGGIYEMGGPERMTYAQVMLRYARGRRLKRHLFTLPGIPIWWMARLVDWLTPVPYPIATALVGGLQSDSCVFDESARRAFPHVQLIPYEEAVRLALQDLEPRRLERVWEGQDGDSAGFKHEGFIVDHRRRVVKASPSRIFARLTHMGGDAAWPFANWLWRLRGSLDQLLPPRAGDTVPKDQASQRIQGPGQGNNPALHVGQRLDYYIVEALENARLLRLRSTLRAPGDGWMEWRVDPLPAERCVLTQTAFFAPRGLPGFLYWFLLRPLHQFVFKGTIEAIRRLSEAK
jgi:uncharacterized protein YbjT (DUF2867 family)